MTEGRPSLKTASHVAESGDDRNPRMLTSAICKAQRVFEGKGMRDFRLQNYRSYLNPLRLPQSSTVVAVSH